MFSVFELRTEQNSCHLLLLVIQTFKGRGSSVKCCHAQEHNKWIKFINYEAVALTTKQYAWLERFAGLEHFPDKLVDWVWFSVEPYQKLLNYICCFSCLVFCTIAVEQSIKRNSRWIAYISENKLHLPFFRTVL